VIEITSTPGYAFCAACSERAAITIEMTPATVGELVRAFVRSHGEHRGVSIVVPGPAKVAKAERLRCEWCSRPAGAGRDEDGEAVCSRCARHSGKRRVA